MKPLFLLSIIFFVSNILQAQISGIVKDSITGFPISYVNISFERESRGTTTDKEGKFFFPIRDTFKNVIVSAVGYTPKKYLLNNKVNIIYLVKQPVRLKEVVVTGKMEKSKKIEVASFKRRKIKKFPREASIMRARFFPYNEKYSQTPFIKKIKVVTKSKVSGAKFRIRLYSIGVDGKPEKYLHDSSILCSVKKGKRVKEVDLSSLKLQFPKKGFFIALEELRIESNVYEYSVFNVDLNKKQKIKMYNPLFGIEMVDSTGNYWHYDGGEWFTRWEIFEVDLSKVSEESKKHLEGYCELAMELILTN